jgi:hypothetical protein
VDVTTLIRKVFDVPLRKHSRDVNYSQNEIQTGEEIKRKKDSCVTKQMVHYLNYKGRPRDHILGNEDAIRCVTITLSIA